MGVGRWDFRTFGPDGRSTLHPAIKSLARLWFFINFATEKTLISSFYILGGNLTGMERFTGPLLIVLATCVAGTLLFLYDKASRRRNNTSRQQETTQEIPSDNESEATSPENNAQSSGHRGICCGMHAVCEKTTLTPIDDKIVYYDDEELDAYRGRSPESYTPEEEEQFREVLMTLLPEDVAGWARSMQLREVELPTAVRDELLMIVDDLRGE